jgi:glutathione S-transferase
MIVYGASFSPFVRKVLAFGAEKGMALESKPLGFRDPDPEFRAVSPFGKIPAFRDGDFSIADSTAIIVYLEAKQPEPKLIPDDPADRARAFWYDEYADTILTTCGLKMFFNRIVGPMFVGIPGDHEAADKAESEELPPLLDYLEGAVSALTPNAAGERFLVAGRITLADIAVASPFVNLTRHLGLELAERWPQAMAYVEAILARPSFRPLIEREVRFFERVRAAA